MIQHIKTIALAALIAVVSLTKAYATDSACAETMPAGHVVLTQD
ncbi:hypothetical protein [Tritonibacter horizontis]|uniref:Uncharacterized protein n=1 Tax=Tritonibacter horizontis TaxID=1768241 RepID=A0A132BQQ8_9RHOB|nr:hypothetical protein [Tritonibacter horizontis]KUP90738.1 hypothetical protein TRIHO_46050 [Tritonibacter horizontis]